MPDKLTDKEIVKALECCGDEEGLNWCVDCPYYDKENDLCQEDLHRDALDLINRLQAESETLRAYIHDNGLEWDLLSYYKRNEKLKGIKTNDWLIKGISAEQLEQEKIQAWKAEAYKEFAERLKKKLFEPVETWLTSDVVREEDIDSLLKELVGEDK